MKRFKKRIETVIDTFLLLSVITGTITFAYIGYKALYYV